ncbi:MAG: adenylyltransferase, partial [Candidatus Sedimenticola sp. 6PFRAG1]
MQLQRRGEYDLVDLMVNEDRAEHLKQASLDFKSLTLSQRQLCDLELLLNGAFTPLQGFMGRADYESVVERMRLADGTLWPMPITLDVPSAFAQQIEPGETIALRDHEGFMPAVLTVTEKWQPDKHR